MRDERLAGKGNFAHVDVKLQASQHRCRGKTGDYNRGQHRSQHNKQQVIGGVQRRDSNHHGDTQIGQPFTRDLKIKGIAHTSGSYPARKIRDGNQPNCPSQ